MNKTSLLHLKQKNSIFSHQQENVRKLLFNCPSLVKPQDGIQKCHVQARGEYMTYEYLDKAVMNSFG